MKTKNPLFSYQLFTERAGLKSKGFLYNVIKGKRNLTKSSVFGLMQAMKLSKDESNYFECLVAFNQAENEKERNYFYEKLLSVKSEGKTAWNPQIIRKDQYEFFSKIYHSTIRALIDIYEFKNDFKWLASKIYPPISVVETKKSVNLLENLGFIVKNEHGIYKVTNKSIAAPNEIHNVVVMNYHKDAGNIALKAMIDTPQKKRDISGMTLGISKKCYDEICQEIKALRQKISKKVEEDNCADLVYQLNFQFFPLSNDDKSNENKNE